MPGTHASHELIELVAAVILSFGGGLILVRAALDRRASSRTLALVVAQASPARPAAPAGRQTTDRRAALTSVRRFELLIAVGLSAGAGAIHVAAGPAHVEKLGDLGLGFYGAAIFQGTFAAVLLVRPRSRRLAWIGMAANLGLLVAWAWSRTIALPTIPGGPESMGVADGTAAALQVALVGLLTVRLGRLDSRLLGALSAGTIRAIATSSVVAILGVVALSTTIAVADAAGGDSHAGTGPDRAGVPVLDDDRTGHGATTTAP